jgi:hypothetical protein
MWLFERRASCLHDLLPDNCDFWLWPKAKLGASSMDNLIKFAKTLVDVAERLKQPQTAEDRQVTIPHLPQSAWTCGAATPMKLWEGIFDLHDKSVSIRQKGFHRVTQSGEVGKYVLQELEDAITMVKRFVR